MRDPILTEYLHELMENKPFDGSWKLTGPEMMSLAERLSEISFDIYQRGYDEGFDSCMETFREGAETLFGIKV